MDLENIAFAPPSVRTFRYRFDLADDPSRDDPFNGERPQFFLRRDFAAELGFLLVWPESLASSPPQTFLYGGLFLPDAKEAKSMVPFISDGRQYICPEKEGLFAMLEARIAGHSPAGLAHFVYPGKRSAPSAEMTFGPYLVTHSAVTGVAQILPCRQAIRSVINGNGYGLRADA